MAIPASSRSRTTCDQVRAPPLWAGTVSLRVCSSSVHSPRETADEDLACALDVVAGMDDDLDALAADLRLELVGRAAGDDLAVVDDRDRVGQLVGLLEVLGRQQERRALADERRG